MDATASIAPMLIFFSDFLLVKLRAQVDNTESSQPARSFDNSYARSMQALGYLRSHFKDIEPIEVDFDLSVAYFLQETNHLDIGKIPASVDIILEDLKKISPQTTSQKALEECAQHILAVVNAYHNDPTSLPAPFALRYPDLQSLQALAQECAKAYVLLPKNPPAVFVDLYGCVLAVSLPPKRPSAKSKFILGQVFNCIITKLNHEGQLTTFE